MVHTRGHQGGAESPANSGSSAAVGDSVAFIYYWRGGCNKLSWCSRGLSHPTASTGTRNCSSVWHCQPRILCVMKTFLVALAVWLSGVPRNVTQPGDFSGRPSRRLTTQKNVGSYPDIWVGLSTDTENVLLFWKAADESVEEHHTHYGASPTFEEIRVCLVPLVPGLWYQLYYWVPIKVPHRL